MKSVIFDLDGTLTDSLDYIAELLFKAMKPYLPPRCGVQTIKKSFGPTERYVISQYVPQNKKNDCLKLYNELYEKEHKKVKPYPYVKRTLDFLYLNKIKMFLCTGKSRAATEISLGAFGWRGFFTDIVTGDDTKNFKPSPEGINKIIKKNKLKKEEVIFIGDSQADIDAASRAGVKSGFAAWSGKKTKNADVIFKTPLEIRDFFLRA